MDTRVFRVAIRSDLLLFSTSFGNANGHWASGPRRDLTSFHSSYNPAVSGEQGVMDIRTNLQKLAAIITSFAVLAAVVCGLL